MKKTTNCKSCNDTGFVKQSNIWAFSVKNFSWVGVCEKCDIGMDIINEDDNYTDMKDFRRKKREVL